MTCDDWIGTRAQVEAHSALAGEAHAEVRQAAIGPIARPLVTRLADALTASNAIIRRMVSDEGIEQAARAIGMRGIRQIVDHTGETIDETWDDFPDEHRAQCRDLALAALSSLLTGGV